MKWHTTHRQQGVIMFHQPTRPESTTGETGSRAPLTVHEFSYLTAERPTGLAAYCATRQVMAGADPTQR